MTVEQKLSTVQERLETVQRPEPVSASTQPPPLAPLPPETPPAVEPTHAPATTTVEQSNVVAESIVTTTTADVSSTTLGKNSEVGGDGTINTHVPTGEPTTPHTDSTESHFTGATGDIPQKDSGEIGNSSMAPEKDNSRENETEGERVNATTDSGDVIVSTEGVPKSDDTDDDVQKKIKSSEQVIAALQSEYLLGVG